MAIRLVDQQRRAACRVASHDIAPTIADHKTMGQIKRPTLCGCQQETRPRLATSTVVGIVMKARQHVEDRQFYPHTVVHLINLDTCLCTARDIWLVGHDDQCKPRCYQTL